MGYCYQKKWNAADGTVKTSPIWWIKYYRDGKPIRESSESEKESDAKKILKLREGDIVKGLPILPRVTLLIVGGGHVGQGFPGSDQVYCAHVEAAGHETCCLGAIVWRINGEIR